MPQIQPWISADQPCQSTCWPHTQTKTKSVSFPFWLHNPLFPYLHHYLHCPPTSCPLPLTWWTIGMLLLTNFLTIYIHFSHTLAGVVTTSLTVLYLPSNPLQPCSIACTSFWIITRLLTLICWWFSWPYSHWNASPLLKHSLIVALV